MSMSNAGNIAVSGMQTEIVIEMLEAQKIQAEGQMHTLVNSLKEKSLIVEFFIVESELWREVNEFTEKYEINLIVMGTHGAYGLKETFIGSNAQKIVRKATVPVLTVNNKYTKSHMSNMVFSADFIEENVNKQLLRIKDFSDIFEINLHLLYVNTPTYFEETSMVKKRMDEVKEKFGLTKYDSHIYNAHQVDEGVISFAAQNDIDLIAVVTHGYGGMKKIFNDNVTESIVNHSVIPVISLHIQ